MSFDYQTFVGQLLKIPQLRFSQTPNESLVTEILFYNILLVPWTHNLWVGNDQALTPLRVWRNAPPLRGGSPRHCYIHLIFAHPLNSIYVLYYLVEKYPTLRHSLKNMFNFPQGTVGLLGSPYNWSLFTRDGSNMIGKDVDVFCEAVTG